MWKIALLVWASLCVLTTSCLLAVVAALISYRLGLNYSFHGVNVLPALVTAIWIICGIRLWAEEIYARVYRTPYAFMVLFLTGFSIAVAWIIATPAGLLNIFRAAYGMLLSP